MNYVILHGDEPTRIWPSSAVLTSEDQEKRAPASTVLSDAFSDEERAEFNVFPFTPLSIPDGMRAVGSPYFVVTDNEVVERADLEEIPLVEVKDRLFRQIDGEAEQCRLKYITAGAGQAMTYQRKFEQAERFISDSAPVPQNYPLLAASVGIEGDDLYQVAQLVLNMSAMWEAVAGQIETARLGAKALVATSETITDAEAVVAGIAWP